MADEQRGGSGNFADDPQRASEAGKKVASTATAGRDSRPKAEASLASRAAARLSRGQRWYALPRHVGCRADVR